MVYLMTAQGWEVNAEFLDVICWMHLVHADKQEALVEFLVGVQFLRSIHCAKSGSRIG